MTEDRPDNVVRIREGYAFEVDRRPPLPPSGQPPYGSGMEERVTRLETHMEYVRRDLDDIRADQKTIQSQLATLIDRVSKMPTVNGLWGMIATVIGVALAMVGAVIGVIALYGP